MSNNKQNEFSKKIIDQSLSEIYQDDGGRRINVRRMEIKPKRGFWLRLGIIAAYVFGVCLIIGAAYWFFGRGSDATALEIKISAPDNLVANQSFEYTVDYQSKENVALAGLELNIVYPDNFVFESSFPSAQENNNKWRLDDVRSYGSGQVKIKGRLIAPAGSSNSIFADLTYHPVNISSEFKKSASFDTILASSGIDITATAPTSVLAGQVAEVVLKYKPQEINFIDGFTMRFEPSDNLEFPKSDYPKDILITDPGVFVISQVGKEAAELHLKFKYKEKVNDTENLKLTFQYRPDEGSKVYVFEEKIFPLQIVKNSLNLTIVANGQLSDQGADFGQTINYSITYVNKGTETMEDVVIMAVLDGEALNWRTLADKHGGQVSGHSIIWTKNEIPELKSISKDQEGSIDFSIPVKALTEASLIHNFEIKNYAQFAVSGKTEDLSADNDTNRSNQLIIKINSDVALDEAARYFNEDNIAVGTGPLPPKVGETSTFKVYWHITNSLHELGALKAVSKLPSYVSWDGKERAEVGTVSYDQSSNEVTWLIGRLPVSVTSVQAEFSISITPKASDKNKVLILVSGTSLTGNDNQTSFPISETLKAQTTKLEKDDIASTDGIVK